MKHKLTTIFFLFFYIGASLLFAQSDLTTSLRQSSETHIYKLTKADLDKAYLKKQGFSEDMLVTPIAKYKNKASIPPLERGNYVKVRVIENELVFEELTIDNLKREIIPAKEFVLCLYDTLGNIISDATMKLGNSKMRLSKENKTYSIAKAKNNQTVEIDNNGVYHFLEVNDWGISMKNTNVYRRKSYIDKKKYIGFVVFNKPKYKPNETVKFKAYLAYKNETKYSKPISIRLKDLYSSKVDTVLTTLSPYQAGMYTFEFPLSPQLDLTLDQNYQILLDTGDAKDNQISGTFRYEDYELNSIKLSVKSDKKEYYIGDSIAITAKVSNENNMPVYGGRIEIEVNPSYYNYFSDKNANKGKVLFMPNQLWKETFELKDFSEKTITLPDSIFPSDISLPITVKCTYWSTDNEVHTDYLNLERSAQKYNIDFSINKGMLSIRELLLDQPITSKAKVSFFGSGKELSITLPDTIAVPWTAFRVDVETEHSKKSYLLQNAYEDQIQYEFYRSNDSVILKVDNPANIPFWYTIEKMSKIVTKGYTTELDYVIKDTNGEGYRLQLIYLFGGRNKVIDKSLPYTRKNITLGVDMPSKVYPGQKTNVDLSVTDLKGKPVPNVDITAYSFTSKFGSNRMPQVPFGGIEKTAKTFNSTSYDLWQPTKTSSASFGKGKWLSIFDLDSLAYYKFLYPDSFYSFSTETTDGTTQVSPYIVIDGALQGVHMMWIDDILYYANQAEQLPVYTFEVKPGTHTFAFRTYDRNIKVSNVAVEKGKKYTFSFDASKDFEIKNTESSLTNMTLTTKSIDKKDLGKLSNYELAELRNQLISISNNFGGVKLNKNDYQTIENPSILKAGKTIYYVNPNHPEDAYEYISRQQSFSSVLVGPFPQRSILNNLTNIATVSVGDSLIGNIAIDGGNQYTLYPNYQKVETWGVNSVISENISPFKPKLTFRNPLTKQVILDSVQSKLIRMMQVTTGQISKKDKSESIDMWIKNNRYKLQLQLNNKESEKLPTLIYFEPQKGDTLSGKLYYGGTRSFSLPSSKLTLHLIYSDTTSYSCPITLQLNGQNYLQLDSITNYMKKNTISELAYKLFDENLTHIQYPNPYIGVVSDSVNNASRNLQYDSFANYSISSADMAAYDEAEVLDTFYTENKAEVIVYDSMSKPTLTGAVSSVSIRGLATRSKNAPNESSAGSVDEILLTKQQSAEDTTDEETFEFAGNSMRSNFHDDAFWQPKLKTGIDGKTSFEVEYPDDITNWDTYFIAIGGKQQYDTKRLDVKSYKNIYAQLFTPRFAVRGDSIVNVGKITNYGDNNISASQIIDVNGQKTTKDISLKNAYTAYIPTIANIGDSVKLSYSFQMANGYLDGEQRSYPILEKGVLQTAGDFKVINDASTHTLLTDASKGTITFHAEASSLDLFLDDIQRIDLYPYMCNEQMASKVRALLMKEYVYKLKNEKFKDSKKIKNLIKDIEKNQNQQKMWGWWNREQSIFWISKYIINTLLDAEKAGYSIQLNKIAIAQSLQAKIDNDLKAIPMLPKNKNIPYAKVELLQNLELLYRLEAKIDYAYYFDQINILLPDSSTKDKIYSLYTMSLVGLSEKVDAKTLLSLSHKSILGATYWGEAKSDKQWWRFISPAETNTAITILAYKTLRNITGQEENLASIRNYFLEQRNYNGWGNTYESASILFTIMPDMLDGSKTYNPSVLTINGKQINKFPYTAEFPNATKIEVSKTGTQPLFVTAYQSEWNANPTEESSKGFQVSSVFTQNSDTIANLKEGKSTMLRVKVTLDGDADYAQLEVPIPAGCSYESTYTNYRKENHREYFKDKVVIFCDKLSKGEHQFDISLMPRYTGRYTVNPAKVELMYFPTFFGNNVIQSTEIEEN